ncbi:cadherin-like and PC-esterase domain-containing protein 1 isoform X2 [Centruroides sculpturatus]|uniref:cadherin-like and PC-esterase domain-containing protein 1 isoform X2 n=1 Tax=Centruroides sculpturatus TaxID=218467 RepID=UPI000C6E93DB|nr:cadherin-like and PC-esterase domain-containing protein 1 isoform X2 [Centruroides sculpturatus]
MRISQEERCGIQKDRSQYQDWIAYMADVAILPLCKEGDAPGRWVLPCKKCHVRKTCYWREAVWQPYNCRHALFSRTSLSKCLARKKLLFIGDSTNRGMMHYLMERVNGSLMEWDKTHDIRIVSNLNEGKTSVAFAYYPQFWLSSDQRPVFDKALYQLIQRSRPLDNTSDTILIVGGVQWLATQHLLMLLRVLKVEKLNGIQLVLKTLGSGFHQAVDGVHSLSVVIKVPYPESIWKKHQSKSRPSPRYHVEGSINAIYSEILLSRICKDYISDVS